MCETRGIYLHCIDINNKKVPVETQSPSRVVLNRCEDHEEKVLLCGVLDHCGDNSCLHPNAFTFTQGETEIKAFWLKANTWRLLKCHILSYFAADLFT